ncbi:hypothetical protein B0T20DRAFT_388325 [Sordaria brevicollis]|uniref:Uncharacterized protein n=1 Tax=Sordaria brevicollis TaxID=83679 RepID=A0AAE0UG66_SORBR|nr:hypothetical protein B0T20DRAFT_388325 [Sordaria brevicollis]
MDGTVQQKASDSREQIMAPSESWKARRSYGRVQAASSSSPSPAPAALAGSADGGGGGLGAVAPVVGGGGGAAVVVVAAAAAGGGGGGGGAAANSHVGISGHLVNKACQEGKKGTGKGSRWQLQSRELEKCPVKDCTIERWQIQQREGVDLKEHVARKLAGFSVKVSRITSRRGAHRKYLTAQLLENGSRKVRVFGNHAMSKKNENMSNGEEETGNHESRMIEDRKVSRRQVPAPDEEIEHLRSRSGAAGPCDHKLLSTQSPSTLQEFVNLGSRELQDRVILPRREAGKRQVPRYTHDSPRRPSRLDDLRGTMSPYLQIQKGRWRLHLHVIRHQAPGTGDDCKRSSGKDHGWRGPERLRSGTTGSLSSGRRAASSESRTCWREGTGREGALRVCPAVPLEVDGSGWMKRGSGFWLTPARLCREAWALRSGSGNSKEPLSPLESVSRPRAEPSLPATHSPGVDSCCTRTRVSKFLNQKMLVRTCTFVDDRRTSFKVPVQYVRHVQETERLPALPMESITTSNHRATRRSPLLLPRREGTLEMGKCLPSIDESGLMKVLSSSRHVTRGPLLQMPFSWTHPLLFCQCRQSPSKQDRTQKARTIMLTLKTNGRESKTWLRGKEECPDMVGLGNFSIRVGHGSVHSLVYHSPQMLCWRNVTKWERQRQG